MQASLSSQDPPRPLQTPAVQKSAVVHGLSSLQVAPSGVRTWVHWPFASQLSVVQGIESLQSLSCPPLQAPALQVAPSRQGSVNAQTAPSVNGIQLQLPVFTLHRSWVHGFPSSQLLAEGWQTPAAQRETPAQGPTPGAQTVPPGKGWCKQLPLPGSQLSWVQGLLSLQLLSIPWQFPALQPSGPVQGLPSSQGEPSPMAAWPHWPLTGSQVSLVQTLPSLQDFSPPMQAPPPHMSHSVQALPSSQGEPCWAARNTHTPVPGSQLS